MLPVGHYFFLSFGLLLIGLTGALLRRNPAVIAMSVALIATAAAINFVIFSRFFADPAGQNFALILGLVALAEALLFAAMFARHSTVRQPANDLTAATEPTDPLPPTGSPE